MFLIGIKRYRKQGPLGSPLTTVAKALLAAARKWRVAECGSYNDLSYKQVTNCRCLDKAMIIDNLDAMRTIRDPWRLCSLNQVEEVKLVLRLFPIWLSCLMLSGITVLQRIGIGLFLSIFVMVVSALVEAKRINIAKEYNLLDHPKAIVPMKVWWLLPQYIIAGLADIFTFVGLQELFYAQMPEAMRSLGAALYLSVTGVGNFISSAIISMVQAISSRNGEEWLGDNINRAHLDYFYWVLAGLSSLNFCVYVWIAKCFVYKKVEEDDVPGEKELGAINGYVDGEII
ncbi:protein nrt1/ ptr family 5.4 [Quercus suber]|uniref:Protein nrt1/ ptr family 5.4 n=1 Tax=Quercus suber TaxID=58331 RepID=A0AAW0M914_QUESU